MDYRGAGCGSKSLVLLTRGRSNRPADPSRATQSMTAPNDLPRPAGWTRERLPDGSVCLRPTRISQLPAAGAFALLALLWNGFSVFVFREMSREFGLFIWLFSIPFLVAGLAMVGQALWFLIGREELRVRSNHLEIERRIMGFGWTQRHDGGALCIEQPTDNDKDPLWRLKVATKGREHRLPVTGEMKVRALAAIIARETGWSLKETEEEVRRGRLDSHDLGPHQVSKDEPVDLPPGWERAVLPDGTVRLARSRLPRWGACCWYSLCAVGCFLGLAAQIRILLPIPVPIAVGGWFVVGGLGIGGLIFTYRAARAFLRQEEWLLGPDRFEIVGHSLFSRRVRSFKPGVVRVQFQQKFSEVKSVLGVVRAGHEQRVRSGGSFQSQEIRALAAIIAQETGWPLEETGKDE